MLTLFGLGVVFALYVLLLDILPRYLYPEMVRQPLQWAHRASVALIVGAVLVSGIWNLSIRYPMLFTLLIVGSGLVGGLRAKLGVISEWARPFARTQMVLTPIITPMLFLWAAFSTDDVVYSDANVTIKVSTSTGWLSDITSTRVMLYQAYGILFDKCIGNIRPAGNVGFNNESQDFGRKEWWQTVQRVTVNTDSLTGVVRQEQGYYPFQVSKPWQAQAPPAAPAPKPTEAPLVEDDKVYTYVEEMPAIPGDTALVSSRAINRFVEERLVLPPTAKAGVVFLRAEVNKAGRVRSLRIEKGLSASIDSAVVAAARQLPLLVPGRQNGRPINVSLLVPVRVARAVAPHKAAKP